MRPIERRKGQTATDGYCSHPSPILARGPTATATDGYCSRRSLIRARGKQPKGPAPVFRIRYHRSQLSACCVDPCGRESIECSWFLHAPSWTLHALHVSGVDLAG